MQSLGKTMTKWATGPYLCREREFRHSKFRVNPHCRWCNGIETMTHITRYCSHWTTPQLSRIRRWPLCPLFWRTGLVTTECLMSKAQVAEAQQVLCQVLLRREKELAEMEMVNGQRQKPLPLPAPRRRYHNKRQPLYWDVWRDKVPQQDADAVAQEPPTVTWNVSRSVGTWMKDATTPSKCRWQNILCSQWS